MLRVLLYIEYFWLYEKSCFVTVLYCNGICWRVLLHSVTGETERDDRFDIAPNRKQICMFFFKYGTGCIQIFRLHLFAFLSFFLACFLSFFLSLLYSIVSYRYGTIQQPHAAYKTFVSHASITIRIDTIQHMTQVYKCEYS